MIFWWRQMTTPEVAFTVQPPKLFLLHLRQVNILFRLRHGVRKLTGMFSLQDPGLRLPFAEMIGGHGNKPLRNQGFFGASRRGDLSLADCSDEKNFHAFNFLPIFVCSLCELRSFFVK